MVLTRSQAAKVSAPDAAPAPPPPPAVPTPVQQPEPQFSSVFVACYFCMRVPQGGVFVHNKLHTVACAKCAMTQMSALVEKLANPRADEYVQVLDIVYDYRTSWEYKKYSYRPIRLPPIRETDGPSHLCAVCEEPATVARVLRSDAARIGISDNLLDKVFCGVCYNFALNRFVEANAKDTFLWGAVCAQAVDLAEVFARSWGYSADASHVAKCAQANGGRTIEWPPARCGTCNVGINHHLANLFVTSDFGGLRCFSCAKSARHMSPPVQFDGFTDANNWFKLERQYTGFDPLGPVMEVAPFYSP
eukprot:jgi/Mesvir1/18507/Mv14351-RA.1